MLTLYHHQKFEDKMNLFTIKTEFMGFLVTTVTWPYKTMKRRDDGTNSTQSVIRQKSWPCRVLWSRSEDLFSYLL